MLKKLLEVSKARPKVTPMDQVKYHEINDIRKAVEGLKTEIARIETKKKDKSKKRRISIS